MDSVRTESEIRRPKFLKRLTLTQPYPDIHKCVGNLIGNYHDRDWYCALGKAREDFKVVEQELVDQLHSAFKDKYCSTVHFQLFMIGRGRSSAKPTIMFFCEEKDMRKKAKRVIDNGGLLDKLPGFRTGHQAKQPNIGSLIQPATQDELASGSERRVAQTAVYYDPSCRIRALGMPIFVKHNDDTWRRATAYMIYKDDQLLLMSVSHIFTPSFPPITNTAEDDDSDHDLGSDAENDIESADRTDSLRFRHMSIADEPEDFYRPSSNRNIGHTPPIALGIGYTGPYTSTLKHIGKLADSSADQDWALIVITNGSVISALQNDHSIQPMSSAGVHANDARVILYNAGRPEGISGLLSANTTFMRLPGSVKFEALHHVDLDTAIDWGDCGALVLDAVTKVVYGHVVASSENRMIAFIVPLPTIFKASGTTWTKSQTEQKQVMQVEDNQKFRNMILDSGVKMALQIPSGRKDIPSRSAVSDHASSSGEDLYTAAGWGARVPQHPANDQKAGPSATPSVQTASQVKRSLGVATGSGATTSEQSTITSKQGPVATKFIDLDLTTGLALTDPWNRPNPTAKQVPKPGVSHMANFDNSVGTGGSKSGGGGGSTNYIFRIDEITESSQALQHVSSHSNWVPTTLAEYYVRKTVGSSVGATGKWWYCDGQKVCPIDWTPPEGAFPYKTVSTIFDPGYGFRILNGDATNLPSSDNWHRLFFDWDENTFASYLTNAGTQTTMRVQDKDSEWPSMLLPRIYHGLHYAASGYGGLRGDLAIFLSLIAFSMKPERLQAELPRLMEAGRWRTHSRSHGRAHKRGVIVNIYPYNDNHDALRGMEEGYFGNYFD